MNDASHDLQHMQRACRAAERARGFAEPNPTVGCVIAMGEEVLAEGWTQTYGSDHAEVHAIAQVAEVDVARLANATMYVTLEPCCHHGKTPPCTDAIIQSGIRRVVIATDDPFPQVAGKGLEQLRQAGVDVQVGVGKEDALQLLAPYLKRQQSGRPWIMAKWAMTLDGKMATASGDSQWISSPTSRKVVHQLRGRVDGIMVGIGTAIADDPLLTARPPGPRVATRIVFDSRARLPLESQLVKTAGEIPVLLVTGPDADQVAAQQLADAGVSLLRLSGVDHGERLNQLMDELGQRNLTNVLVEGGAGLLGGLLDGQHIDEVHAFIAPKIVGGSSAITPVGGTGRLRMQDAISLNNVSWLPMENDIYMVGRVTR